MNHYKGKLILVEVHRTRVREQLILASSKTFFRRETLIGEKGGSADKAASFYALGGIVLNNYLAKSVFA